MSRAKRTLLLLAVIEIILAGLWFYLARMAAHSPNAHPEAAHTIGATMGAVMGVVLGLSPFLYLLARSNDRKAAAGKEGPDIR